MATAKAHISSCSLLDKDKDKKRGVRNSQESEYPCNHLLTYKLLHKAALLALVLQITFVTCAFNEQVLQSDVPRTICAKCSTNSNDRYVCSGQSPSAPAMQ
eukprot:1460474-Amphidinium_carterae.1